jgi:hypothetical protein
MAMLKQEGRFLQCIQLCVSQLGRYRLGSTTIGKAVDAANNLGNWRLAEDLFRVFLASRDPEGGVPCPPPASSHSCTRG